MLHAIECVGSESAPSLSLLESIPPDGHREGGLSSELAMEGFLYASLSAFPLLKSTPGPSFFKPTPNPSLIREGNFLMTVIRITPCQRTPLRLKSTPPDGHRDRQVPRLKSTPGPSFFKGGELFYDSYSHDPLLAFPRR